MTSTTEQRAAAVAKAERAAEAVSGPFAGLTCTNAGDVMLLKNFAAYLASHGAGVDAANVTRGLGKWVHAIDSGHVRQVRPAEADAEADVAGHRYGPLIVSLIRVVGEYVGALPAKNNVSPDGYHWGGPFDPPKQHTAYGSHPGTTGSREPARTAAPVVRQGRRHPGRGGGGFFVYGRASCA